MSEVVENPERHRFELAIDGSDEVAGAYYRLDDNGNLIRASGRKAVLRCPFMAAFYSRHPEYSDIVVG